jgi:hypothetical protein
MTQSGRVGKVLFVQRHFVYHLCCVNDMTAFETYLNERVAKDGYLKKFAVQL